VDGSGQTPDGQTFQDIEGFRKILLANKAQIARNLVERLMVYSTGGDIQFSDRQDVEAIVSEGAAKDYGLRTLIHAVVDSRAFNEK
jgi:prephenate dehydratase